MFLAETWADEARLDRVLRNFDFNNKWVVSSDNRGGGLALLWKDSVTISVEDSSKYCIDALIDKGLDQVWHFTGFYDEPITLKHFEAWNKLKSLNTLPHIPWLCAGDFNEITRQKEKLGDALRNHNQMQLFREVIDECNFMDLGFVGSNFTWSKHFEDVHSIWERLDRDLATNS